MKKKRPEKILGKKRCTRGEERRRGREAANGRRIKNTWEGLATLILLINALFAPMPKNRLLDWALITK
jgi:hypothetical protein